MVCFQTKENPLMFDIPAEHPRLDGAEKWAFPIISPEGQQLCLKVVKPINGATQEPQDRAALALAEFEAYQIFERSALAPYIPHPVCLVYDQGQPVGLIIEWKNGLSIYKYYPSPIIPLKPEYLKQFFDALWQLPEQGFIPNEDCFGEVNLMVGPKGELWLSECGISAKQPSGPATKKYRDFLQKNYSQYCRDLFHEEPRRV